MPKLTLNYACIVDVMQVEPKPTDNQRKNRKVILHVDEEDLFDMFDQLNPKNIIKYLDMRKIPHREALEINVTDCTVKLTGRASKQQDGIRHGLYNMNQRNKKKLNRALELLDNMKGERHDRDYRNF